MSPANIIKKFATIVITNTLMVYFIALALFEVLLKKENVIKATNKADKVAVVLFIII